MKRNDEILGRIIAAIEEKTGEREVVCPLCGDNSWEIGSSYVVLPISKKADQVNIGGERVMGLVAMHCKKCGSVQFINMLGLGFKQEELESMRFEEDAGE
jgi:hypothetical protein